MSVISERFDRNIRLFGLEGQRKLNSTKLTIVGIGGLGTQVVQQLSLLGVGALTLVDHEEISVSNKNRYVGVYNNDRVPGTLKVDVGARLIQSISPETVVSKIAKSLVSLDAFEAIEMADYVFGCVDDDGPRFVLNDAATAFGKPYIDLASDVIGTSFGGRVVFKTAEPGCLFCFDELNKEMIRNFLESPSERANRESIYGIDKSALGDAGPSVVSINGVVASLAVTEFMRECCDMGQPRRFLNYDGHKGRVSERFIAGRVDCPYCSAWGKRNQTDLNGYLRLQLH